MPGKIEPPRCLDGERYFVMRYDRETEHFTLVVPSTASSFDLGDAVRAREYFTRIGMEYLGGRALDSAFSFGSSQALVRERRAFGLDTTVVDPFVRLRDQELTRDRLLGTHDDDDEVIVL